MSGHYIRPVLLYLRLVGKIVTQRIECHHLNLRTHIQRLTRKRFACLDQSSGMKKSSAFVLKQSTSTEPRHGLFFCITLR